MEGRSESSKLVNSRRTVKIDWLVNDETKQDLMQFTCKALQIVPVCAPVLAVLAVMHIFCLLPDYCYLVCRIVPYLSLYHFFSQKCPGHLYSYTYI